ncbi:TPA: prepilin-type N-terminal cleavage/methylation domain-containing protein [Clostridium perfringens]
MYIKKQNKKKKGFTLIELIIVIAIIAILAAIAIPNFLSIQRKSRVKADIASAKTIYDATSALISEGKIVPGSNAAKVFKTENGALIDVKENAPEDVKEIQDYLQTIPVPESEANSHFSVKITGEEDNPEIKIYIDGATKILVYPNANNNEYKLN